MNILIIGSGGREHALAWKISQSPLVDQVWSAPGNPGMNTIGPCFDVKADDIEGLEKLVLQLEPDLVVVGPEKPLALGLADLLRARGFDVFGPSQAAAQLEASKAFSKDFMARHNIPTANYGRFTDAEPALRFLDTMTAPYVLKADGLASGKGVVIAETREQAEAEINAMLSGKFGAASSELVIEAFMDGEEASVFVVTDGTHAAYLPAAQDHKRIGEGDTGPNTGGMGSYAPAPVVTESVLALVKTEIVEPTLAGLSAEGTPYQGVLYVGLMITDKGPKVVEYNCRFGDPECQALMAGLEGDIVAALLAASTGGFSARDFEIVCDFRGFKPTANVVLATNGYPGSYAKGSVIRDLDAAETVDGVTVFQAGTDVNGAGELIAIGGRVLNVTATADTLADAFDRAYRAVDLIDWPEGVCRRDIGWRVRPS